MAMNHRHDRKETTIVPVATDPVGYRPGDTVKITVSYPLGADAWVKDRRGIVADVMTFDDEPDIIIVGDIEGYPPDKFFAFSPDEIERT